MMKISCIYTSLVATGGGIVVDGDIYAAKYFHMYLHSRLI